MTTIKNTIKKYMMSNGLEKIANNDAYIERFIDEFSKRESLHKKADWKSFVENHLSPGMENIKNDIYTYAVNLPDPLKKLVQWGLISSVPSAALGYMTAPEDEQPWRRALRFGAVGGLTGGTIGSILDANWNDKTWRGVNDENKALGATAIERIREAATPKKDETSAYMQDSLRRVEEIKDKILSLEKEIEKLKNSGANPDDENFRLAIERVNKLKEQLKKP